MPKVGVYKNSSGNPEVDVVRADLENALFNLAYLLEGRIDDDNILEKLDGATTAYKINIPSKHLVDSADATKPVDNCMKFYGFQGDNSEDSVSSTLWEPLTTMFYNNKNLKFLQGSAAWSITKEVIESSISETSTQSVFSGQTGATTARDDQGNVVQSGGMLTYKYVEAQLYNKTIVLPKPANYKPLTYKKFWEYYSTDKVNNTTTTLSSRYTSLNIFTRYFGNGAKPTDYIVSLTVDGLADFVLADDVYVSLSPASISVYDEEIHVNISFSANGFDADEYANLSVTANILCEVLP